MSDAEVVKIVLPLIIINYALVALCLVLIWKKGTKNLNKWIWTAIVVLLQMFGPIGFLIFGRKDE